MMELMRLRKDNSEKRYTKIQIDIIKKMYELRKAYRMIYHHQAKCQLDSVQVWKDNVKRLNKDLKTLQDARKEEFRIIKYLEHQITKHPKKNVDNPVICHKGDANTTG